MRPTLGPALVLFGTLGLYLAFLLPRLLWIDNDGVWVGQEHLWSDWPLHLSMARHFADSPRDALQNHPFIGGEPLRYPFAIALLSGGLMRLGLSITAAFLFPILVLWFLLLWGMYRFWALLLGRPWLALVPIFLFFLSAGLGGFQWLVDIRLRGLDALLAPPQEYGRVEGYEWWAGNFLVGMLLPQRAFLPGMTLTIWLLVALLQEPTKRRLLGMGLAAGCLPIVHVHSLLALLVFGMCVKRWQRSELMALLPGGALAVLLWAVFLRPTTPYPNFISLRLGYQAQSVLEWPVMWWRFWGIVLPATAAGFLLVPTGPLRRLLTGASLLFVLGNVILFQPIAWDNSKVFLWVYFAFCGSLTYLLAHFWKRGALGKTVALMLALALSLTGIAELIRLQRTDRFCMQILSAEDARFAAVIEDQTPVGALFLTNMDISNAPLWAGRSIFLGFGGWMPNFGFDHRQREADLPRMYSGSPEALALLKRYRIQYVWIGPEERKKHGAKDAWFSSRFPLILQQGDKCLYQIPP